MKRTRNINKYLTGIGAQREVYGIEHDGHLKQTQLLALDVCRRSCKVIAEYQRITYVRQIRGTKGKQNYHE